MSRRNGSYAAYSLETVVTNYNTLPRPVRAMLERKYDQLETAMKADIAARKAQRDADINALMGQDATAAYATMKAELDAIRAKINQTFDVDLRFYNDFHKFDTPVRFRVTGHESARAAAISAECDAAVADLTSAGKARGLALAKFAQSLVDQREALVIRQVKASFTPDQVAAFENI